jgi:osmotically-inducible protein OsmY
MKTLIHIVSVVALVAVIPAVSTASSVISAGVLVSAPLAASTQAASAAGDDALATKVKATIAAEPEFSGNEVIVTSTGGVVTLDGVAANPVVRVKIVEKAQGTEGVTKVVNKIKLAKTKK